MLFRSLGRGGDGEECQLALDRRSELLALTDVFQARVVDVGHDAIVFEVVGEPEELDSFEELVRPHGIREMARTGRIGLARASTRTARQPQHVLR